MRGRRGEALKKHLKSNGLSQASPSPPPPPSPPPSSPSSSSFLERIYVPTNKKTKKKTRKGVGERKERKKTEEWEQPSCIRQRLHRRMRRRRLTTWYRSPSHGGNGQMQPSASHNTFGNTCLTVISNMLFGKNVCGCSGVHFWTSMWKCAQNCSQKQIFQTKRLWLQRQAFFANMAGRAATGRA